MLGQLSGGGAAQGDGGLMGMVGGLMGGGKSSAGGGMDLGALSQMLDADGDSSPLNDILGKFMK